MDVVRCVDDLAGGLVVDPVGCILRARVRGLIGDLHRRLHSTWECRWPVGPIVLHW